MLELAQQYDIAVEMHDGRHGRAYRAVPSRGRRARIWIPEIRGQISYLIALHELGHIVSRGNRSMRQLEAEADAWRWALEHSLVEPTQHSYGRLHSYLESYLHRAHARHVAGARIRAAIPPPESTYWALLSEFAVRAELAA